MERLLQSSFLTHIYLSEGRLVYQRNCALLVPYSFRVRTDGDDPGCFGLDLRYSTPVPDMSYRFVLRGVSRAIQNIDRGNSLLLCHYKFRQSNGPYSYGLVNDHSTESDSKFVLSLVLGVSSQVPSLSCLSSDAHPRRWKFFST